MLFVSRHSTTVRLRHRLRTFFARSKLILSHCSLVRSYLSPDVERGTHNYWFMADGIIRLEWFGLFAGLARALQGTLVGSVKINGLLGAFSSLCVGCPKCMCKALSGNRTRFWTHSMQIMMPLAKIVKELPKSVKRNSNIPIDIMRLRLLRWVLSYVATSWTSYCQSASHQLFCCSVLFLYTVWIQYYNMRMPLRSITDESVTL